MSRRQVLWTLIKDAYVELVTYGVPGPVSLSYFVPFVLLPAALLIPPTYLSRRQAFTFFLVPIYGSLIHAWISMGGVDVISVDAMLWSTFFIAYKDPRKTFTRMLSDDYCPPRHISVSSSTPQMRGPQKREQAYPQAFGERLQWVGSLLASTRLHRWKIGEKSHDKAQDNHRVPTRMVFVLSLLPNLLFNLAIFPLVIRLAHFDPNVPSLHPTGAPPRTISTIKAILPPSILTPLVTGLYIFTLISGGFLFPAPLAVLTNYLTNLPPTDWSPHTLPAYFGPFTAVLDHGVAGLWGTWWHQHMRIMVSFPGAALADALRASPSARYTLRVASAFFFSGVAHMGLVPRGAPDAMVLRLCAAGFFWVQAGAVLFESAVARAWRASGAARWCAGRAGVAVLLRAVRLLWVIVWMCGSLSLLVGPCDRLHWWRGWQFWPVPGLSFWLLPYTSGEWIP